MKKQRLPKPGRTLPFVSILSGFALLVLTSCTSVSESQPMPESRVVSVAKPVIDSNNVLTRPEGYRKWMYVGTPLTPERYEPARGSLSRVSQRLHPPR